MQLRVKVTPNARDDRIVGWEDASPNGRQLRVRLQAPPVDGKANKALVAFLAKQFGVAKSSITIVKGRSGRVKVLELPDQAAVFADRG